MKTPQDLAIEKDEGPCIVLAGAGTGKTHTIVEKINHLTNTIKKYRPEEILCLTFSNGATNSLKKKVCDKTTSSVTIRTFHAFCADVLKEDGHLVGIDEGFCVLLPDDAKILVHKHLEITPYWSNRYVTTIHSAKDFGLSVKDIEQYCANLKENVAALCSGHDMDEYAKEQRTELSTLYLEPKDTLEERRAIREKKKEITRFLRAYDEYSRFREFIDVWKKYDELKNEKNLLDYSDLNQYVLQLLRQFGSDKYTDTYKYIFVDEFQDTNKVQFELIEHLAAHRNITVVGDPNQSVYGFRGAYKESFEHFKQSFDVNEDTDVFKLDRSYRSPNTVLNIAHKLVKNNYGTESDCILVQSAQDRDGEKVKVIELANACEEARYIADLVEKAIDEGVSKSSICILYRTHRQSEIIRHALELKGIPVISAGRTNMMQRREIRTVVAYLSVLSNIAERTGTGEQSWWDLFHYHNTLSPGDSVKIGRYLKKRRNDDIAIDEALLCALEDVNLSEEGKKIAGYVASKLKKLLAVSNKSLPELVLDIYELSGLNRAFTYERTTSNIESLMNLRKFYEIAENFYEMHEKTLSDFIRHIEIIDTLGVNVESSKVMHIDAVRMMTIHATKGLEYDLVIVSNMAEDRFPVTRTRNEPLIPKELLPDLKAEIASWGEIDEDEKQKRIRQYEKDVLLYEERRLCYVAWTRAKDRLVLTYARSYNSEPDSSRQSVFLDDIEYRQNPNCELIKDDDETSTVMAPCSSYERYKLLLKEQVVNSLDSDDFNAIVGRIMNYVVCRDKQIADFSGALNGIAVNNEELERHLLRCAENRSSLVFPADEFTFSPTGLIGYDDCPKRFELAQLLQMPQRGDFDMNGGGATTGSFVHKLFEYGVKSGFDSRQKFVDHALKRIKNPEWNGVDIDDVSSLIDVFWERNKDKYDEKSKTEVKLSFEIDGFRFYGIADRIDVLADNSVEIIDYKTNKNTISPKKRSWQLGFYAIGLQQMGYKVSRLTLDMLRLEKPVEMSVDDDGNVTNNGRGSGFKLEDVKNELLDAAKSIAHDYEHEFDVTEDDSNCRFCGYKFYCPKCDEN